MVDEWITNKGENPLEFVNQEANQLEVNDEDISNAVTRSILNKRVHLKAKLKTNLIKARSKINQKSSTNIDFQA